VWLEGLGLLKHPMEGNEYTTSWLSAQCLHQLRYHDPPYAGYKNNNINDYYLTGPPLWSSGQGSWLLTQRLWVRFPALPVFLSSSGSGMGVHPALVRINEELLETKVAAPV
jgi:hypothetical protein